MCPDQKDFQPSWETAAANLMCESFKKNVTEITCYCKADNCNAGNEKPTKSQSIVANSTKPGNGGSNIQLGMGMVVAMVLVGGI